MYPLAVQVELYAPSGSPMSGALDARQGPIEWHVAVISSGATWTRARKALQSIACMATTDVDRVLHILQEVEKGLSMITCDAAVRIRFPTNTRHPLHILCHHSVKCGFPVFSI